MGSLKTLNLILVIINCLSICHSLDFCRTDSQNKLIDTLFAINDTIYAFRKPDIFVLRRDEFGNWTQIAESITLRTLFRGHLRNEFDSGFSVSDFVSCDYETDQSCPFSSPHFDPTNITFLFFKREFFLYRRIGTTQFEPIDPNGNHSIPWNAHDLPSRSLTELFDDQEFNRVEGAIFLAPEGSDSPIRTVLMLSYPKIIESRISDNIVIRRDERTARNTGFSGTGNGGFVDTNGNKIFIFDNKLYRYVRIRDQYFNLRDTGITTWTYFNCDRMEPFTTTTTTTTTTQTPTTAATDGVTGNTTQESIWNETEPVIQSQSSDPTEELTDMSSDQTWDQTSDTFDIQTASSEDFSESDATGFPEPPLLKTERNGMTQNNDDIEYDRKQLELDREYGQRLKTVLYTTLALLAIGMVSVTLLLFLCFNILS